MLGTIQPWGLSNGYITGFPLGAGGIVPGLGRLPHHNTPSGFPPPVSGNSLDDMLFSVWQGVGTGLRIRQNLNAQQAAMHKLADIQHTQNDIQLQQSIQQHAVQQLALQQEWARHDAAYALEDHRLTDHRYDHTHATVPLTSSNAPCDCETQDNTGIATIAQQVAQQLNQTGYCAKGVRIALNNAGYDVKPVDHAYEYSEQLSQRSDMTPVSYADRTVGDVVVYGPTSDKPHGHVAIVLNRGQEASDHIANEVNPSHYGPVQVFRPTPRHAAA